MPIKIRHVFFMLIFLGLLFACRMPRLPTNATATLVTGTPSALTPTTTRPPTIEPTARPTETAPTPFPTITLTPFPQNVFDNFQNRAGNCGVKTTFGKILPGETIEEAILSETTIGKLWFSLSWRGGDLDLTLLDPDGNIVDRAFPNGDKINESFTSKPGLQEYFFGGPQAGQWTAKISAKSVPATGSDYKFEVSSSTALLISTEFDKQEYFSGDTMKLSTLLLDDFLPLGGPTFVLDAVIKVTAEDPAQNQYSFELYDNGTHGDAKAGDGEYANSFDKTSLPGIYKFAFQMSGHNIRAGEPLIRECFLAKTVKLIQPTPSPIPGGDDKICKGGIRVSEPIMVRAEDVGGNDSSDYSRYAFDPQGVSTNAGILVIWRMGFNGESPQPNAYKRLLDDNANPIGDVNLLFEQNVLGQSYSLVSRGNDILATYLGRFDNIDKSVSDLLDSEGHLISEEFRLPDEHFSARESMKTVWTGTHFMFGSSSHHYTTEQGFVYDLILETADSNGKSISSKTIVKSNDVIRADDLAVGHERMLLTVGRNIDRQNHIFIYHFDLEGNELGEPVIFDPPLNYEQNGKILPAYFGRAYTFPTADGWMVLWSSVNEGIYVAYLDPAGALISSPRLIDGTLNFGAGFGDIIPYHGGAAILGRASAEGGRIVFFVSAYGTIGQKWNIPKENVQDNSLLNHKGHLFLVYATGPKTRKPDTNQVLIRELQCVP
jgi:hypothetical protein